VYLSPRLNRLLTQQALLDAWRAQRTRCYMSTRAEQSVTLGVGADHAVLEWLLLWVNQVPNTSICPTMSNTCVSHHTKLKPSTEQVQAFADILHSALCCNSNETRPPLIASLPHNAQLDAPSTIPPSYTPVHAVVWECSKGQTTTQTDTDARNHHTFCLGYASHKSVIPRRTVVCQLTK